MREDDVDYRDLEEKVTDRQVQNAQTNFIIAVDQLLRYHFQAIESDYDKVDANKDSKLSIYVVNRTLQQFEAP